MNQSKLLIGEFKDTPSNNVQLIDIQDFHFKNLFHIAWKQATKVTYLLRTDQADTVFRRLSKEVQMIRAAGGLVRNAAGAYLFIYRLGKWDLPKGKAEQGETSEQTAVREVEEECGIQVRLDKEDPYTSYHTYLLNGEIVLKRTDWYAMHAIGDAPLIPQLEEDITEARWLPRSEWDIVLKNTYPLIKDFILDYEKHGH